MVVVAVIYVDRGYAVGYDERGHIAYCGPAACAPAASITVVGDVAQHMISHHFAMDTQQMVLGKIFDGKKNDQNDI